MAPLEVGAGVAAVPDNCAAVGEVTAGTVALVAIDGIAVAVAAVGVVVDGMAVVAPGTLLALM
jgi:hypothetical protein